MKTIILNTDTSRKALQESLAFIKDGFKVQEARILVNSLRLPDIENEHTYPLTLKGILHNHPTTIKVFGLSAGYKGEGPYTLVQILKEAGFVLDYDGFILSKANWTLDSKIDLTCFPDGETHDLYREMEVHHQPT